MNDQIYPISLSNHAAKRLVMTHARPEWDDAFHRSSAVNTFYGYVQENGDVKVHVHYSFDDGYVSGGGTLFEKTIHPFNEDELKALKRGEMLRLAAEEYEKRRREKEEKEILKLAVAMFGSIE